MPQTRCSKRKEIETYLEENHFENTELYLIDNANAVKIKEEYELLCDMYSKKEIKYDLKFNVKEGFMKDIFI